MRKNIFLSLLFALMMTIPFVLKADEIHDAAKFGDLAKVQTILEKDPNIVNLGDKNGKTPLHWASQEGHSEIVKFLLEKGADVNTKNNGDETPLHYASNSVRNDVVKLLIEKGAKVDSKNNFGRTSLHYASYVDGSADICRQLIKNGADINAKDFWGYTPLRNANGWGRKETVNLLIEKGADLPTDHDGIREFLHNAALTGHRKLFDLLIANGASIKIDNGNGGTLLHSASWGGTTSIAKYMINMDFQVNAQNRYGMTPLHLAASNGHKEVVELLLSKGADTNVRSKSGLTAFNYAEDKNHGEIIALLKARDADRSESQFPVLKGQYLGQKRPGTHPEIFALGIISSIIQEHSSPSFSPDGKEVYWTGPSTIMFMRLENGRWSPPEKVSFSSDYGDGEPAFSPDGKKLFFLSFRPIKEGDKPVKENIWYVERVGNGWSDAKPVGDLVNALPLHWQVSIASNGNLYFGSSKAGGKGRQDIYVSRFINGQYSEPENLGGLINSEFYEHSPYIALDESYLIFTRTDQGEKFWNSELFMSFRKKDGSWKRAKKIDYGINTDSFESCPIVSPDEKYLFFLSNRNGNFDVYWVDAGFFKELKNKEMKDDFPVLKGPYLGQKPPGMTPEIFAPGIVSTENQREFSCTFSPDGKEFYFNRNMQIMVCKWRKTGWTKPEPVKFTEGYRSHEPHITADNKRLFFGSMRPRPGFPDEENPYGIWMVERTEKSWSKPRYVGYGMYVTTTKDGEIYLEDIRGIANLEQGIARTKLVNGRFTELIKQKGGVVHPAPGWIPGHPCISPDGSFIIFDSYNKETENSDLFICFREDVDTWSEAIRLDDSINNEGVCVPYLSPDEKYFFFSRIVGNTGDIYWVDARIIDQFRPESLKKIK